MIFIEAGDIRNWIITLVILVAGLFILLRVGKGFIAGAASPGLPIDKNLLASIDSISLLMAIGISIVILFLIPFYLSKRSQEKQKSNIKSSPNV